MLRKITHIVLTAIFSWVFLIAAPFLGTKHSMPYMPGKAYAASLPATDMSAPDPIMAMEWRRIAGREDAVFLNIPSNQIGDTVNLPEEPNPIILAKYDEATATGMLAVMKLRQVGANLEAGIFRITPRNFQHFFGPHLYQFAFLNWIGGAGCDFGAKHLHDLDPPRVDNNYIISEFNRYNLAYNLEHAIPPAMLNPMPFVKTRVASEQHRINRSNFYWHQKLNNNPCWERAALRDFDKNNGMFNNISHFGFLRLVTLAQEIHNAPTAFVANPKIRQAVQTSTSSSFFRRTVTTTVSYFLSPEWTVSTVKAFPGMHSDFVINATWNAKNYSFVKVQGDHTFPVDETLIHQWTRSQSGWTGIFVFFTMFVVGLLLPGLGHALIGGAIGGFAGLMATGFNPSTNVTAHFTPFVNSVYQLDPSRYMSGDARVIADLTRDRWVMPDPQRTPGGVERYIMKIDKRKILRAGTVTNVNAIPGDRSSAIEVVGGDDPRFNTIFNEMFYKPHRTLQQHKYPFVHDTGILRIGR